MDWIRRPMLSEGGPRSETQPGQDLTSVPTFRDSEAFKGRHSYVLGEDRASQVALVVKNPPANGEDVRSRVQSLGWEDPLEDSMQPTPVFLPGESHGRGAWWATVHRVAI